MKMREDKKNMNLTHIIFLANGDHGNSDDSYIGYN